MLKLVFEISTFIALFILSEPAALLFPTPAAVEFACPLVAIGLALAEIEDSLGFNVAPMAALMPSTTAEPIALDSLEPLTTSPELSEE